MAMFAEVRPALVLLGAFTLLTGVAYPAVVTVSARILFPRQAEGSLVREGSTIRGSTLIGQSFSSAGYFWGRPSAAGPANNAAASSGSNLGPGNPALAQAVTDRVAALRAADPSNTAPVPVDLVTASGSGLDPHITPAAAAFQAARVARARGIPEAQVQQLVAAHTEGRTFGVLGEPRVNVLALNMVLDSVSPARR
jgi:K+-transporting ATPase ATPase C chain